MTYVVPQTLEFLRHGAGAPLWRLLTSPGNAVAVNAVSAVVVAVCVGFVVRRLVFWHEQFEGPADANADLTAATESWGKAKVEDVGLDKETGEAILTIPAPADKGFFIVNPKPDVQSNRSGRPDTADIQHN